MIWTVDFKSSVTVEADTEDEAVMQAIEKLEDGITKLDLEFFDFDAWQE